MTEANSMHRFTFDECIFADNTDPVIVYMVVLILLPDWKFRFTPITATQTWAFSGVYAPVY